MKCKFRNDFPSSYVASSSSCAVRGCEGCEKHYQIQHQIILFNKMYEGVVVQGSWELKFMQF